MDLQTLITSALAAACAFYSTWVLMPSAWRRRLAMALRHGPWPAPVARWLELQAAPAGGCACSGCDAGGAKVPAQPAAQPVRLVRRPGAR